MSEGPAKGAGHGGPAKGTGQGAPRGYSWPPFEPENFAAVTHGARSPRIVAAGAEERRAELLDAVPWLRDPEYAVVLKVFATEVELHGRYADAAKARPLDSNGQESGTAAAARRHGAFLLKLAEAMGLTPMSKATIARDVAIAGRGLAHQLAEARRGALPE